MSIRGLLRTGFVALFLLSTAAYAEDAKPAADAPKAEAKPEVTTGGRGRLVKPFSELKDLTPEQTVKIKEIHSKYLAEIKALSAKDKEESMAVLTDDQKKEMSDLTAKAAAEKKASKVKKEPPAADSK